jgi:crotonobetainyl-CoA:carnitine CoA-transferase CaiB-like acyl-CoA transferase
MSRHTLDGLLVVSLEQAVAAPLATRKLADAGARIIKVEQPGSGDFARGYDTLVHGESSWFVWLNRGKESLDLDLKDDAQVAFLRRICRQADVFLQNLAPGAATRLGLDSAELRATNPRLITCDISGYGEDGPYAAMKAFDNLVQGESGLLSITGLPEEPAKVGISICDISAGTHAFAAILEALLGRARTGAGQGLKISLFDCLADWMTVPYLHQVYGGKAPARTGLHHATVGPYGPYAAKDGRRVIIAVASENVWVSFCGGVLRRPELAADPRFETNHRRIGNRAVLEPMIAAILAELEFEEMIERLRRSEIPFGRINTVADLAAHPQLRRITVETPTGPAQLAADPLRVAGWVDPDPPPRVPALGEHGATIRREFGA